MKYRAVAIALLCVSIPAKAGIVDDMMQRDIKRIIAGCVAVKEVKAKVATEWRTNSLAAMQAYWEKMHADAPGQKSAKGSEIYWKNGDQPMAYRMVEAIDDTVARSALNFAEPKDFVVAGNRKSARGIWTANDQDGVALATYRVDFRLSNKEVVIDTIYIFAGDQPDMVAQPYCKEPGDFKGDDPTLPGYPKS